MKSIMTFKKSTKGTHVYQNAGDNAPVTSLYIKKEALPEDVPQVITVVIEPGGE